MTPKEYAFELVSKYRRFLPINLTTMLDAKGCAIIAVDEIINVIEFSSQSDELSKISYWERVKQEIEKL